MEKKEYSKPELTEIPKRKRFKGFPTDLQVRMNRENWDDGCQFVLFAQPSKSVKEYFFTEEWHTHCEDMEDIIAYCSKGDEPYVMRLPEFVMQRLLLAYLESGGQLPGINNDELERVVKVKNEVIAAKESHISDLRNVTNELLKPPTQIINEVVKHG